MVDTGGRLDLAIVMPVYNEAECIAGVLTEWLDVLARLGISGRMIVLNDGSKDATASVLAGFARDPRVEIINKTNSGHGPTILEGYRKAVREADWVFQVDSDGEIAAAEFPAIWRAREGRDAVMGIRIKREAGAARWLITSVSRVLVKMLFGGTVKDVNVPFRLIRSDVLESFLDQIPAVTFAPNVIISGVLSRGGFSVANLPVTHQGRKTGQVSIVRLKLWKVAVRAGIETIRGRSIAAPRRG